MILIVKLVLTLLVAAAFSVSFFYPSLNSGFLEELEILGMGGAIGVLSAFLLFVYFYCKDLQKTLELISPHNRVSTPRSVWLMFLIPYNFIEDFFIIINISKSIKLESKSNILLSQLKYFGLYSGIGWCTAQIISLAPGYTGKTAGLVAIILWVIHWHFIRNVISSLKAAKKSNQQAEGSSPLHSTLSRSSKQ